jgi:Ca2+-binding EF-hand superfamily protein
MNRGVVAACAGALALLVSQPAWSQDNGQDGQAGMGEVREGFEHLTSGEPRRGPGEAVRRSRFDEAVEKMFAVADTDRNGLIALAELRAVIEARKDAAIRGRFASVDADRNQSVSFAEFNQWQRSLGSVVLSDEGAAAASNTVVAEDIRPAPERGPGGQVLARLVVPLNATMLVAANADHDGGASLAEIAAYEGKRFEATDTNDDGWVTEDEMRQAATGG